MHLRSLLLGAAAALAAVPAARAADAVVIAEPEPVEYVRVCDAFGAGFFYIPGTETCLRISGYVRYRVGATSDDGVTDTPNFNGYAPDGWNKETRARVNIDARQSTEWGLLRSYLRLQATWGVPSDGPVRVDQAWISLGGLRMGYSESAWSDTVGGVNTTGSHSDGALWYGDQQRHFIQYNFGGDEGIFGVISLEDDTLSGEGYMPDVVGVLSYQQGWGGVWGRVGYDESFDGFGASVGVQLNVPNTDGSNFRLIGYYADGDHAYGTGSSYGAITGGMGNSEWAVLTSYYHQITERLGGSVGFEYFSDFYAGGSTVSTGLDGYVAEVSLIWEPVDNFEINTEVTYDKIDTFGGSVGGFVSFKRSF
ncbi:porin [Nitratireductor mangrovi]|uniref:Porin n=1 Tax=Nitratireductor mangrovi TaxID=2599600 RepID=A0A5B8L5N7_9HYPH|nr:porin [Nitratireductor mangrovi]QDZ03020.2 porin [Nitratireductor mangrovi]